ncbi:MAG: aminoacyl-tRNA hydrolase [Phycisphaeraceae bacterium]|nr:aminoacyl-tRNA hydrolase [Phycisphaeraceae bacterium]
MKLIIGLGNPTPDYDGTRHNVGFEVVDRLAGRHGFDEPRQKFHAHVHEGRIGPQRVLLMKPTTYMNRSGQAVSEAARFYKVEPSQALVVVDDTALPVGQIRLRSGGSAGGHNGLTDIEQRLGTADYPRLRVGIGAPRLGDRKIPQADYVLGRFTEPQRRELEPALQRAAEAAECWLAEGAEAAMNRFNSRTTAPAHPNEKHQEGS